MNASVAEPKLSKWERLKNVTLAVEEIPASERPKNSSLKFRVRMKYADGESVVVPSTLRSERWQAEHLRDELTACQSCREAYMHGGPSHNGSRNCESGSIASGGSNCHCACSTCY
jgi:hypothetical protein